MCQHDWESDQSDTGVTSAVSAPRTFVDAMRVAGCDVDSPWDLVNRKTPYRSLVPVLLELLDRVDVDVPEADRQKFREGLVRALGVKEARGEAAAGALVREFRRPELDWFTRWAVANSLSVVADESVFDDLVALAMDRSYARAREMLMLALARSDETRAAGVLIGMLDDDDLAGHAISALGKVGASEARSAIEKFLDHPKPWVRKEAEKVLRRFAA